MAAKRRPAVKHKAPPEVVTEPRPAHCVHQNFDDDNRPACLIVFNGLSHEGRRLAWCKTHECYVKSKQVYPLAGTKTP